MINKICVAGAGTMGRGIGLSAALAGYEVIIFDAYLPAIEKAGAHIGKDLSQLTEKGKISNEEKEKAFARISFTSLPADCKADLVIEAIIEDEQAKISLFRELAAVNEPNCILASNTSSLSINFLQEHVPGPERLAGLHFFNPAHLMKLVEVVKGEKTSDEIIQALLMVCARMKKTTVICKDSPGFIVNRVARHYYLEAMRITSAGIASVEEIDSLMESVGFRMGPFRLMDLIGMDINLAVSRSVYKAFENAPRFEPSPVQIAKVEKGELGRKTGKGFYDYSK